MKILVAMVGVGEATGTDGFGRLSARHSLSDDAPVACARTLLVDRLQRRALDRQGVRAAALPVVTGEGG